MDEIASESTSISYFCMNSTGKCQLEANKSKKAIKPGELGERCRAKLQVGGVIGSFCLMACIAPMTFQSPLRPD